MRRLWLAALLVLIGCADEIPEDVSEQMEAARTANQAGADTLSRPAVAELLVTAPPGGHADWVHDIRTGLDTVPAQATVDRGEALYIVQELYSRRYIPLSEFYGTDGAADPAPELAQAVERAGARLQALMRQLAEDTDAAPIEETVRGTQEALEAVVTAASQAGLPPAAPRDL